MKCIKCGNDVPESSALCPFCGNQTVGNNDSSKTERTISQIREKLSSAFKDTLFLTLCIMVSASAVFSLAFGGIPILLILFAIFLWLIFAKARRNTVDTNSMRNVSGTVFASYIINWVLIGSLVVASIIGILALTSADNVINIKAILRDVLSEADIPFDGMDIISKMTASSVQIFTTIVIVAIIIGCIVATLINIFAVRNIHKFARSLYKSAESGKLVFEKADTATTWFLVLGILNGMSAIAGIGNLEAFLANGCISASYIIAYALLKKYFDPKQVYYIEQ